jgi:hypothetical protein
MPGRNITSIPLSTDPLADDDLLIVEVDAVGATRSVRFETVVDQLEVTPSSAVPQRSTGTGAAGTSADYARADHVHPATVTVETNSGASITPGDTDSGKIVVLTGTDPVVTPDTTLPAGWNLTLIHRAVDSYIEIGSEHWEFRTEGGDGALAIVNTFGTTVALIVAQNGGVGERIIYIIGPAEVSP